MVSQSCDMRTFSGPEELILSEEREKSLRSMMQSPFSRTNMLEISECPALMRIASWKSNFSSKQWWCRCCPLGDSSCSYSCISFNAWTIIYLHFSIIKPSFRRPIFRFFFPILKWRNLPLWKHKYCFYTHMLGR